MQMAHWVLTISSDKHILSDHFVDGTKKCDGKKINSGESKKYFQNHKLGIESQDYQNKNILGFS